MKSTIHHVKFYKPQPREINCLAYNKYDQTLAVSRKDASIEIWDLSHAPFLLRSIPGVENGSVEALCWVGHRLFSTGLSGALVEWHLKTLTTKATQLLTGNAAWCLDVNASATRIAVGTEGGYVNLFSVDDNTLMYDKIFDKQEGRILCCKFDKTGDVLVTGSVESIRIWNVATGQAIHRLSVNRRGKETIVWCLEVLSDLTIISGDSSGRLTFWDGSVGEQIESFCTHRADILSLSVSEKEDKLYCAGVDPLIINFSKVKVEQQDKSSDQYKWVRGIQRLIHLHDVRALQLVESRVISAGADGYIAFSSYPPKSLTRVPPTLPGPCAQVYSESRLLLLRYLKHVEVWQLNKIDKADQTEIEDEPPTHQVKEMNKTEKNAAEKDTCTVPECKVVSRRQLEFPGRPVKLLTLHSKDEAQMTASAMSPDGKWIAYSTDSDLRIFKFAYDKDEEAASLSRVVPLPAQCGASPHLAFTQDAACLVAGSADGRLHLVQIDAAGTPNYLDYLDTSVLKDGTLLHLVTSAGLKGHYIAASDCVGNVAVWFSKGNHHYKLCFVAPRYTSLPTAMNINPDNDTLHIVYSDQQLVFYDLQLEQPVVNKVNVPNKFLNKVAATNSISFGPRGSGALTLHDDSYIWVFRCNTKTARCQRAYRRQTARLTPRWPQVVDERSARCPRGACSLLAVAAPSPPAAQSAKTEKQKNGKKSKTSSGLELTQQSTVEHKTLHYKHIVGVSKLSEEELVVVEVDPQHVMSQLPPTFCTRRAAHARNTK